MLTIEQMPKEVTERILSILNYDGVDKRSVQACAFGLACANLGITNKEDSLARIDEVAKDRTENNREYVRQVLTIYANETAREMFDLATLVYGERSPEEMSRIKAESEKTIKEIVEKHLESFVELA